MNAPAQHGAAVDARSPQDKYQMTPLMRAASIGNEAAVTALLPGPVAKLFDISRRKTLSSHGCWVLNKARNSDEHP